MDPTIIISIILFAFSALFVFLQHYNKKGVIVALLTLGCIGFIAISFVYISLNSLTATILVSVFIVFVLILLGYWASKQKPQEDYRTSFTGALAEPIRFFKILIKFRQQVDRVEGFFPFLCGFRIVKIDITGTIHTFSIKVKDISLMNTPALKIDYIKSPEGFTRTFTLGQDISSTDKLTIQILPPDGRHNFDPFINLRDFNTSYFTPYIPMDYISRIEQIELVINGWVIAECDPETAYWETTQVDWNLFNPPISLACAKTGSRQGPRPPMALWLIDLFSITPRYLGEGY